MTDKKLKIAANWWIKNIGESNNQLVDNFDKKAELDVEELMDFEHNIDKNTVEDFRNNLIEKLKEREKSTRPTHLYVDYDPQKILAEVCESVGLDPNSKVIFPWKTRMDIYEDKIVVVDIENSSEETIYSE